MSDDAWDRASPAQRAAAIERARETRRLAFADAYMETSDALDDYFARALLAEREAGLELALAATGLKFEFDREKDGRWICEVPMVPGCLVYGASKQNALTAVFALLRSIREERAREAGREEERGACAEIAQNGTLPSNDYAWAVAQRIAAAIRQRAQQPPQPAPVSTIEAPSAADAYLPEPRIGLEWKEYEPMCNAIVARAGAVCNCSRSDERPGESLARKLEEMDKPIYPPPRRKSVAQPAPEGSRPAEPHEEIATGDAYYHCRCGQKCSTYKALREHLGDPL